MRAFWKESDVIAIVTADNDYVTFADMVGFLATNNTFTVTSIQIARLDMATMAICHVVDYGNGDPLILVVEDVHICILNDKHSIRLRVWNEKNKEFTLSNYLDEYYD